MSDTRSFLNYNSNLEQLRPSDDDATLKRFRDWTVPDLRTWLGFRGVRTNDCTKGEMVQLAYFTWKLKIPLNPTELQVQKEANSRLQVLLSSDYGQLPDPKKVTDWTANLQKLPTITHLDIYEYLINSPGPTSPSERLRAFKSLNAYNYSMNGWVQPLQIYQATETLFFVKANVKPSQTSSAPYEAWVIVTDQGSIQGARCACVAGLGEACSHVAALLYKACSAAELGYNQPAACTSVANVWNNAFTERVQAKQLHDIDFSKPRLNQPRKRSKPCRKPSVCGSSSSETDIFDVISEVAPRAGILLCLRPKCDLQGFQVDTDDFEQEVFDGATCLPCSVEDVLTQAPPGSDLFGLVRESVTADQSEMVFKATVAQADCMLWKTMRCCRITASKAHSVFRFMKSNRTHPSATLINSILGELPYISPAMQWGKDNEANARQDYIKEMNGHPGLKVAPCGLKIIPGYAHIGASPDGLVTCTCCHPRLLEIKCSFSAYEKGLSPKDDGAVDYLSIRNGQLKLKEYHEHHTQVQTQMGVLSMTECDFVVWTPYGIHIETITFLPEFWDDIRETCTIFFVDHVIPLYESSENVNPQTNDSPSSPQRPSPPKSKRNKREPQYPCTLCGKSAVKKSVACDHCNRWTHLKCAGLTGKEAFLKTDPWFCSKCLNPL